MNLNEYQLKASETASYPTVVGLPGLYPALGLNGEAGEVAEKIKKFWRDRGSFADTKAAIRKELGDVLWYVSEVAREWGLELEDVAAANLEKLASRRDRGVLAGSGDNR